MKERNNPTESNLVSDVLVPAAVTGLVVFCLVQFGINSLDFNNGGKEPADKVTAISAFSS